MISLRTDAECPSLSPDQTKIAYKKRLDNKARGSLAPRRAGSRTGEESLLAETRSVDDQVEWLDNNQLLYGLSRPAPRRPRPTSGWCRLTAVGRPSSLFRRHHRRR